jgi:protoporphyrinogen oxidase
MSGSRKKTVVVLGGGACGMSAALEVSRLGALAVVLERESRVGGLCGTHERDGFRFDFGGHRFITQNTAIDDLVRSLVGDDMLERRRQSVILNGGKRYRYPLELDDVLRQYGPRRGARALASYLGEAIRQRLAPEADGTFEDWVTHRFGAELYGAFFGPYTAKLWGIRPEEISADWAAQRISLPSLWDVCLRLLHVPRPAARTYARRYRYPRRGIGQIFERCGEEIGRLGGDVRIGCEVIDLGVTGGRVRAVRYRDEAGEHEIACDAVISTLSLPVLARMLGRLPAEIDRSAGRLRFRAIRLLNLMLEGPPISPNTWMYVSEPKYLMARIQEPIHRSPEMAPPGSTSLMLEVPCTVGDETWSAPDAALYERCVADLRQLGLPDVRARTRGYFSSWVREGYPIYHLGYDADRRNVLAHVSGFEGLVSCGRQGAFRYIFMDTAMEMGIEAARMVLAERSAAHVAELGTAPQLHEARVVTA